MLGVDGSNNDGDAGDNDGENIWKHIREYLQVFQTWVQTFHLPLSGCLPLSKWANVFCFLIIN